MTTRDLAQARARAVFTSEQGQLWLAKKQAEIDALAKGTVVVIDIVTGDYVTAKTWLEAHPAFTQRFGSSALGFTHHVGERTFVGGGIGQDHR
jgi:uncharacterized membrane-anchored protein